MSKQIEMDGQQFFYDETLPISDIIGMYTRAHVDLALFYSTTYEGLDDLQDKMSYEAAQREILIKALIRFELDMKNDTVASYPQTNVPEV